MRSDAQTNRFDPGYVPGTKDWGRSSYPARVVLATEGRGLALPLAQGKEQDDCMGLTGPSNSIRTHPSPLRLRSVERVARISTLAE